MAAAATTWLGGGDDAGRGSPARDRVSEAPIAPAAEPEASPAADPAPARERQAPPVVVREVRRSDPTAPLPRDDDARDTVSRVLSLADDTAGPTRAPEPISEAPEEAVGATDAAEESSQALASLTLPDLDETEGLAAHDGAVRKPSPTEANPLRPAWRRYAAIPPAGAAPPMVAIIIDDLGHAEIDVRRAIALDPALTLAFLPYPRHSERLAAAAYTAGHELLLHLPMEPDEITADPGPDALLTGVGQDELEARIGRNLARLEGFVGVNNHMGSLFTRDRVAMRTTLEALNARGLLFVDSLTTPLSSAAAIADGIGIPFALRDVFLDSESGAEFVAAQLEALEAIARENGLAVGIGHPYPETFAALAGWLPNARARGVSIVPISAIAARNCGCADDAIASAAAADANHSAAHSGER